MRAKIIFNDSDDNGLDLDGKMMQAWIAINPPNPETWTYTQDFQAVDGYNGMAGISIKFLHPRWDIVRRDMKLNN